MSSPHALDVIVVGGGIEGLVAAATLARAGRDVTLLEGREVFGGLAARHEFHPGYAVPGIYHEVGTLRRGLLGALALEEHGLSWRSEASARLVSTPDSAGLLFGRDAASLSDTADAAALGRWRAWIERVRPFVVSLLDSTPPQVLEPRLPALLNALQTGLKLRRLGQRDMRELLRIGPLCACDWMQECFEDERLRAGLVAPALLGGVLGPRAAGTGALLLLRECAAGAEPLGGAAALVAALEASARAAGAELRARAAVDEILIEAGRVQGVRLEGGEELRAPQVLSALDPRRTLLGLVPARALSPSLGRTGEHWRARGSTAVMHLALSRPPEFRGRTGETIERASSAPDLVTLERGMDGLKYGELPRTPVLDLWLPSTAQPELAPDGHAVLSVLVAGVPHTLRGGWSDRARQELETSVLHGLERMAPGIGENIVQAELSTPADLETRYGNTGGHLFHGELALDQLWIMRPALGLSRYHTPIAGLTMASSGSHPGGPFFGGAGYLGAHSILQ